MWHQKLRWVFTLNFMPKSRNCRSPLQRKTRKLTRSRPKKRRCSKSDHPVHRYSQCWLCLFHTVIVTNWSLVPNCYGFFRILVDEIVTTLIIFVCYIAKPASFQTARGFCVFRSKMGYCVIASACQCKSMKNAWSKCDEPRNEYQWYKPKCTVSRAMIHAHNHASKLAVSPSPPNGTWSVNSSSDT